MKTITHGLDEGEMELIKLLMRVKLSIALDFQILKIC